MKKDDQHIREINNVAKDKTPQAQPNNPLHGVKLAAIVEFLHKKYGWEELDRRMKMNCFAVNPSVKSTLKFLRKTEWAREKIERLYLRSID
ncbi:VF530 family protein [Patiriisocius marinistellae]|uniref:VF530 family protein n=1 Tax=Patiriisocius marinistellae TaxID=2494560 RepID=UPI002805E947|nr:VF530 family protein [Patiriisocius marinistellae]